jgi:hypothetical protein
MTLEDNIDIVFQVFYVFGTGPKEPGTDFLMGGVVVRMFHWGGCHNDGMSYRSCKSIKRCLNVEQMIHEQAETKSWKTRCI